MDNLERSLRRGDRLGGHLVSGHVDGLARVLALTDTGDGGARLEVEVAPGLERYLIAKGSIALDGVSLTVVEPIGRRFWVALIPETLAPLLEKRINLKEQLALAPAWDPRREAYKARASAHKWLLVTCFGYLGYKNARFGRIEAHEAVTAYGREALLRAKEAAEDLGFTVLHLYVDGMWVKKPGCTQVQDFQPILELIPGADRPAAGAGRGLPLGGLPRSTPCVRSRSP